MNNYRLMFVDDHPLIVEGMVNIAKEVPDIQVIATARNGLDALKKISLIADQLDLVIFDYSMPLMDGKQFLYQLNQLNLNLRKMLLTTIEEPTIFESMLQDGLDGIVLKMAPVTEILQTAKFLIDNPQSSVIGTEVKQLTARKQTPLTTQDSRILTLIAQGYHVKEIAKKLSYSERTIKYHLTEIYQKLGAANRAQAVAIAVSHNWINF